MYKYKNDKEKELDKEKDKHKGVEKDNSQDKTKEKETIEKEIFKMPVVNTNQINNLNIKKSFMENAKGASKRINIVNVNINKNKNIDLNINNIKKINQSQNNIKLIKCSTPRDNFKISKSNLFNKTCIENIQTNKETLNKK